jgi:hypothetical protein
MNETIKKKRGRKPKADKDLSKKKTLSESNQEEPIILHLNINPTNSITDINRSQECFEHNFCKYNPSLNVPNPYNEDDSFISQPDEISNNEEKTIKYILKNDDKSSWKDVACFWCSHKFDTDYLGLPIKYKNNVFEVTGCFCSFECMCAYNFNSNDENMWEIYNLINLMSTISNYSQYVTPAPDRQALKLFGGYMSIETFRDFKNTKRIINVCKPPFVVSVDQIEEINNFYHKQTDNFFNLNKERLHELEKKLKIEESELLKQQYKNTLDATMNIH